MEGTLPCGKVAMGVWEGMGRRGGREGRKGDPVVTVAILVGRRLAVAPTGEFPAFLRTLNLASEFGESGNTTPGGGGLCDGAAGRGEILRAFGAL